MSMLQKKRGQLTLSTDEVLAYPKERYANRPRRIHSADINFATILSLIKPPSLTRHRSLVGANAPISKIVKLMRYKICHSINYIYHNRRTGTYDAHILSIITNLRKYKQIIPLCKTKRNYLN